jgi:hypothetical protein
MEVYMAKYAEDDETIVSICHRDGTAMFSTTRLSIAKRCIDKGWEPEIFNDEYGNPRRWKFEIKSNLISLVPKSESDRAKAVERAKASFAAREKPFNRPEGS